MTTNSQSSDNTSPRFIPLMVRFVTPLNVVLVAIAAIGVFLLSSSLGGNVQRVEENLLVQTTLQIAEATQAEYNQLLQETQRIAFTQGIADAVNANDASALQTLVEPIAAATNLDSVIITDVTGQEIVGLLHDATRNQYSISQQTDLASERLVRNVLNTAQNGEAGLVQTSNGTIIYIATPISFEDNPIGVILAGRYVTSTLEIMQTSSLAEITLYSADNLLLDSTLTLDDNNRGLLNTSQTTIDQTLSNSNQVTVADSFTVSNQTYRAAYLPFSMGESTLGVLSVLMPNNVAFATFGSRQISSFLMAILAGAVTFVAVISINLLTRRVEKVTTAVDALAEGENVRLDMQPTDEIGVLAITVNRYADVVQEREDQFRTSLRRHRRERDYLLLAFEAIPEGIVVQDMDGRVVLMNDPARDLLGSQRVFRSAGLHELTTVVNDTLGDNIAPGLYTIGNPKHIELDEKILLAQASAIVVGNDQRLGSVILMRDITDDVKREQARETIMSQMVEDVQSSLQDTSRRAMINEEEIVRRLARDVAKHSSALQSMIVEMRELTQYSTIKAKQVQRSLSVETLAWGVANDWRQIAQASDITLNVIIEQRGLFLLGDEHRLRYALGNLVDNSVKYTEIGGKLTIEIRGEVNGMVQMRIRDNGVGISKEDLSQIFLRYYRGHPTTDGNQVIHVPGMGQGLTDTQQIITAHGGQIQIKSKVGVGTAVYFTLPATSSTSYQLPMIEDDVMEGETILIPEHVNANDFWGGNDEL